MRSGLSSAETKDRDGTGEEGAFPRQPAPLVGGGAGLFSGKAFFAGFEPHLPDATLERSSVPFRFLFTFLWYLVQDVALYIFLIFE
jgi:hypothetical protein